MAAGGAVALLAGESRRVVPRQVDGMERERLWRRFALVSRVDRYHGRTRRRIPVVVLTAVTEAPRADCEGACVIP